MKSKHIISFLISTLLLWSICYTFNSTAILGKVVLSTSFISPWLTFTTVMKYFHLGMGTPVWVAYTLSGLLLAFLWVSLYIFVSSLIQAVKNKKKL